VSGGPTTTTWYRPAGKAGIAPCGPHRGTPGLGLLLVQNQYVVAKPIGSRETPGRTAREHDCSVRVGTKGISLFASPGTIGHGVAIARVVLLVNHKMPRISCPACAVVVSRSTRSASGAAGTACVTVEVEGATDGVDECEPAWPPVQADIASDAASTATATRTLSPALTCNHCSRPMNG